jgi:hypothetical protein
MYEDFEQQLAQLTQRVSRLCQQLYQQGHPEQAMEAMAVAIRLRDLARRHLGDDLPDFASTLNDLAM